MARPRAAAQLQGRGSPPARARGKPLHLGGLILKILLTGAGGQLGQAFFETARDTYEVVPAYHGAPPEGAPAGAVTLDLEKLDAIAGVVERAQPDWIVHAAAMTNVDGCERDPERAHRVNAEATGALAAAAHEVGARMVYVSTDYVFDGSRGDYRETDATNPIQAYGRSKLEGERLAQEALPDGLAIARTSVVYGPHKPNFVTWVRDELRAGKPLRIVDDQHVSPTLTSDLSEQILALIHHDATGVYHTAGGTQLSRLDMVHGIARAFGLDASGVTPIRSSELNWFAARPLDSTLDVSKISRLKPPLSYAAALDRLKEALSQ